VERKTRTKRTTRQDTGPKMHRTAVHAVWGTMSTEPPEVTASRPVSSSFSSG
jgi:hypothetical protein